MSLIQWRWSNFNLRLPDAYLLLIHLIATVMHSRLCIILYLIPLTPYFKAQQQKIMELTSAMDKANMNLKGAGEQNMAFAGKIQMLEVDITKIRQVRKVPLPSLIKFIAYRSRNSIIRFWNKKFYTTFHHQFKPKLSISILEILVHLWNET